MTIKGKGLQEGDALFVLVCRDRQVDDIITVHTTRASADESLDAFLDTYDGKYNFAEDPHSTIDSVVAKNQINKWVRHVLDAHADDGPSATIFETKLRGAT